MKQPLVLLAIIFLSFQTVSTYYKNSKGQNLDFGSIDICSRQCSLTLLGVPQYSDPNGTVFRCCQKQDFKDHSKCLKVVPTACQNGTISFGQKLVFNTQLPAVQKRSKKPSKSITL